MSGENRLTGVPYAPDWFEDIHVDGAAVNRRIQRLMGSRSVKGEAQMAWLLKAITLIDLTTLSGDDTPGRVRRLCAKARTPVAPAILQALGVDWPIHTAAVCVYHEMLPVAVQMLADTDIEVAAVSTGFPAGLSPFETRVREIELSVAAGATEIDIVISRRHVLTGNWKALYDEVAAFREACGDAHLKAILATGELGTLTNVAKASMVCMMAGADFIKTSTGKEPVNATLPVSLVMLRQIREFYARTGQIAGFKPAGGISTAKDALSWLILLREELGVDGIRPDRFRFGASSLLGDIERQLEHAATGGYSVNWHHAMG